MTRRDQITSLLARRAAAREAKDWPHADALREQLAALGVSVRDTKAGQVVMSGLEPTEAEQLRIRINSLSRKLDLEKHRSAFWERQYNRISRQKDVEFRKFAEIAIRAGEWPSLTADDAQTRAETRTADNSTPQPTDDPS